MRRSPSSVGSKSRPDLPSAGFLRGQLKRAISTGKSYASEAPEGRMSPIGGPAGRDNRPESVGRSFITYVDWCAPLPLSPQGVCLGPLLSIVGRADRDPFFFCPSVAP